MTNPRHPGNRPQAPAGPAADPHPASRPPATAATPPSRPATEAQPPATAKTSAKPPAAAAPPAKAPATANPAATADAPAKPLSPALDKTFKIGLILKGLDGILEVIGGIILLFLSPAAIQHVVRVLTAHELSEDPHDLVARYLLHTTAHLNHGTTLFGAIYLLAHGVSKVVLVALVLRDKLWAYPWLIALLLAFIAYQLYQITAVRFSGGLTALTVFDAVLVWLTWREYRARRAARAHPGQAPVSATPPGGHRDR